jgi:hypothetical protein
MRFWENCPGIPETVQAWVIAVGDLVGSYAVKFG